jgi:hypothetical protein
VTLQDQANAITGGSLQNFDDMNGTMETTDGITNDTTNDENLPLDADAQLLDEKQDQEKNIL